MAGTIISQCVRGDLTGGQLFHSNGYNVIVNSVTQCDVGYTYDKREVAIPFPSPSPQLAPGILTHIKGIGYS